MIFFWSIFLMIIFSVIFFFLLSFYFDKTVGNVKNMCTAILTQFKFVEFFFITVLDMESYECESPELQEEKDRYKRLKYEAQK